MKGAWPGGEKWQGRRRVPILRRQGREEKDPPWKGKGREEKVPSMEESGQEEEGNTMEGTV